MRIYRGKIFSGIGVATTRVKQNLHAYKQESGLDLIPGTFNVRLSEDFVIPEEHIYIPPQCVNPKEKQRGVTLIRASFLGEKVVILIPDKSMYAENIIEIMAAFKIKEHFHLKDGDEVEVKV